MRRTTPLSLLIVWFLPFILQAQTVSRESVDVILIEVPVNVVDRNGDAVRGLTRVRRGEQIRIMLITSGFPPDDLMLTARVRDRNGALHPVSFSLVGRLAEGDTRSKLLFLLTPDDLPDGEYFLEVSSREAALTASMPFRVE